MNVRAKTKRRVLILLSGATLLGGLAGGGYAYRKHRIKAGFIAAKERGLVLLSQGKYVEAVDAMAPYVKRFDDADVIYQFVQAKKHTPADEGRGKIVRDQLRRFATLRPERVDVWRELSDIYYADRYVVESLDAAQEVLKREPNDLAMLRRQVEANVRLGRTKPALEAAERYHATHRDDGRGDLLLSFAYSRVRELTADQSEAAWSHVEKADPDGSIRGEVAPAGVTATTCTPQLAAVVLGLSASKRAMPDAETALAVARQLGEMGLAPEALGVLEQLDPKLRDERCRRELAAHLFQQNRFAEAEPLLAAMDPSPAASPESLELFGLRAVTLIRLDKRKEAAAAVDALTAVAGKDPAANAWLAVLRRTLDPRRPPGETVDAVRAALSAKVGLGAYPLAALGDAYAELGQRDLAVDAYGRAAAFNLWATPRLKLSRLLAAANQSEPAFAAARDAYRLSRTPDAEANLLAVWARKAGPDLARDAELAKFVAGLQARQPGEERSLALHVAILAASDRADDARSAIRAALKRPAPPSPATLMNLANLSRQHKLGVEDEVESALAASTGSMTPDVALARALRLHRDGKTSDGAKLIESAAAGRADAPEWRVAAAQYVERTGDARAAAAAWAAIADDPKLAADAGVLRLVASMPSLRTDPALLDRTVGRVAATGDVRSVYGLADLFVLTGRPDDAARTLAALDAMPSPTPGEKDFWRGEYESRYGKAERALSFYRAAAELRPRDVQAQTALIVQCLRLGQVSGAVAAADAAAKANPDHAPFALFRKQADALAVVKDHRAVLAVAEAIVASPRHAPGAAEALKVVSDGLGRKAATSAIVDRLRPVADQWPQHFALQRLTVNMYLVVHRTGDALAVARRAMQSFPNAPEAAELAATTALHARDFPSAIAAAERWRAQAPSAALPADLLICDARIELGEFDAAWKRVEPYFAEARAKPDQYAPVIRVRAALLCRTGKASEAAELLRPLLPKQETWRASMRDLAVRLPDAATAARWLGDVLAATPEGAAKERAMLASTWFDFAVTRKDDAQKKAARAILDALAERHPREPLVHFARALADAHDGNVAAAQAGYRKVLELDADHRLALNNLAMSLADHKGDRDEALRLAEKVVSLDPNVAPFRDTLACVLAARGDHAGAAAELARAIALDPGNPMWSIHQAEICHAAGDVPSALKALEAVDRMNKRRLDPALKDRYEKLKQKVAANN